jgi:hypothetical protein
MAMVELRVEKRGFRGNTQDPPPLCNHRERVVAMSDPNDTARRFFEALLKVSIPEGFSADDVWMYMPRLFDFAAQNQPLPTVCLTLLEDLASRLKAGASVIDVMQAIERAWGPCPYGNDELLKLARYIREQRNGDFSTAGPKKGPSIRGEF